MAEHFVRDDVRAFLAYLKSLNRPALYEVPIGAAREGARAMNPLVDLPAREIAIIEDLSCPGPAGDIPLRLYDPRSERGPSPVILFFHGGGFVIGDIATYNSLCTEIAAETGLPVVSVEYRLAPENPFPAAPDDAEAAARWLASNPVALGFDVTGLIPMGDSAGGNLTIVTTTALIARPADKPVVAQVAIYPLAGPVAEHESYRSFAEGFFLTKQLMAWFDQAYAGDAKDPRTYPLLAADHSKTPPTIVLTAGVDPLRDSGREYAQHLIGQGVDVTCIEARGINHGFITMRKAIPSGQRDLKRVYAALKAMLA